MKFVEFISINVLISVFGEVEDILDIVIKISLFIKIIVVNIDLVK